MVTLDTDAVLLFPCYASAIFIQKFSCPPPWRPRRTSLLRYTSPLPAVQPNELPLATLSIILGCGRKETARNGKEWEGKREAGLERVEEGSLSSGGSEGKGKYNKSIVGWVGQGTEGLVHADVVRNAFY